MTFTAIDFETANYERTSACQIGLVVVKNGEIIKEFSSLIKPVPNFFLSKFTDEIHGIDKDMVEDAPSFGKLWPEISDYIENAPLIVAHNASFDMGVLKSCLDHFKIEAVLPEHYCTLEASRKSLPNLENHVLSTVCEYYDIPLDHHEALSDAIGAAKIALKLKK